MAESYPSSHFTGIDNMIYPIRLYRLTRLEWETVINEMVRVTKPGGWLELMESSGEVHDIGPNLSIWLMRLTVSLQTRNILLKIAPQLPRMLEATNKVTDVQKSHRSVPIGWLGKAGDVMLECTERMFDSMKPRLCEDWSMSLAKYDKVVQAASKECRDFKSWTNVHYVSGRKKFEDEDKNKVEECREEK
ncbi:hypothetical protein DFQ28_003402 [Apophysomyces sp. BC1034]|nr:hypothetical protein DFQ28_003402 [Apophysomyces sp. BC1034]